MADEDQDEAAQRRPRVVDKRVSAGGHRPSRSAPPPPAGSVGTPQTPAPEGAAEPPWTPEDEAAARQMAQEIAERPSVDWVVNAAVTLANVAATKIQLGDVADARVAIDALAGIVAEAGDRMLEAEAPVRQTLAQLQMAYAQRVSADPPGD